MFEEFIFSNNLKIENVGQVPTFQTVRARSCIDVTISRDLPLTVTDWKVDCSFNGSDHNTILFKLVDLSNKDLPPIRPWHLADWKLFNKLLSKATFFHPDTMTDSKLDKLVSKFFKVIDKALDEACPLKPPSKSKSKDWFDEKLLEFRVEVRKKYKKLPQTELNRIIKNRIKNIYFTIGH